MPMPVMSLRAPTEHRQLLRDVARMLRKSPELVDRLPALLSETPPSRPEPALGPFRDEAAALAFIRDRLVVFLRPAEIWLFGSRARRDHRSDSDFDILIVFPDEAGEAAYDYGRAYEPVMASGLACDIVPCRESDFDAERHRPGTIPFEAAHHGRLLYRRRQPRQAA